jgi:hypothetical protein
VELLFALAAMAPLQTYGYGSNSGKYHVSCCRSRDRLRLLQFIYGAGIVVGYLAPTRPFKGSCTLNLEDENVLYSLQQHPLNGPLNLENAVGSSICRVSLNGSLSI